jgi:pyruvate, water dikinase
MSAILIQNGKPARPAANPAKTAPRLVQWFKDTSLDDVPIVGGKNASLGEMYRELSSRGIRVPNGFATTAEAYRQFLANADLPELIRARLAKLDTRDVAALQRAGQEVRQAILAADFPAELSDQICDAYWELGGSATHWPSVAVRSSATAEDLPDASFAGQQETYLNVSGSEALLHACKRCFASLFTDRAISYRVDKSFDHFQIALSVGVQLMVRSDLASSGVIFTLDTETGFRDVVLINAAYGLGENVVQGTVNPDEYVVFKPTLRDGFEPILQKTIGTKELRLVYDTGGGRMVKNQPVPLGEREKCAISDAEILELARWACAIEDHYSAKRGAPTPMDIEWAKDGLTGRIYIVQARPETVQSHKRPELLETYTLESKGNVIVQGRAVGEKISAGRARVVRTFQELHDFEQGDVLVTDKTDPDWEPIMKKAGGIVTNRGGRTCHAAIVSRELGVPAIVGTEHATERVLTGQEITLSCAEGEIGTVYDGKLSFQKRTIDLKTLPRPETKIMMNVGNPEQAFALSFIPNDGVGLAREEFIASNYIKVHPMALLDYDQLTDAQAKAAIASLTRGYTERSEYFVDKLAQGVAMIAAAFYPKYVILRLSDFKTNEYANLIGGRQFEPLEENPMIGFRGASRYYHERYRRAFGLECAAVKRVREKMGLKNLKVMIPFCRTVEEALRVQQEMAEHGLRRGEDGLEIYVMCEIPSNVILASDFAKVFDGFSIGSNDLTQLVLGVDRDSEIVAPLFDERNPAVKKFIRQVITAAKNAGVKIGICGQAPSDYPEFAQFLVEAGIDSISLNPDTVVKTMRLIAGSEES